MDIKLLPPEDIIRAQNRQNRELEEQREAARIKNITLNGSILEAIEAGRWLIEDAIHSTNLFESLSQENRLRGLGFLLIFCSLLFLLSDSLL